MAYDRYDTRDAPRDERSRWSDDRFGGRDGGFDRGRRDERGFFERAGDEIASWFGDDDAERRRHEDQSRQGRESGWSSRDPQSGRGWDRDEMSGGSRDRNWDRDRGRSMGGRDDDRGFRSRGWESGEGRGYSASERDYNPSWRRELTGGAGRERSERDRPSGDRDRGFRGEGGGFGGEGRGGFGDHDRDGDRGYRPMTGDYGRGTHHESEQFFAASGIGRGERGFGDYSRDDDGDSKWGRDPYRQTSRAGTRDWTDRSRHEDPHYDSWRQRHLGELDRDYDDFRREHQSRFEDDFTSWRERRQQKRGLLGQIREHMEVVGSDDEQVGTVDRVAGDRIILTKSDAEGGGAHHSLSCADIDRVEGDRVILDCSADKARQSWRDESRNRALFERDDQGEMGPRVLDRSFEGTYRR
jgi:hypothetical protein